MRNLHAVLRTYGAHVLLVIISTNILLLTEQRENCGGRIPLTKYYWKFMYYIFTAIKIKCITMWVKTAASKPFLTNR